MRDRKKKAAFDPETQTLLGRLGSDPAAIALIMMGLATLSAFCSAYAVRGAAHGLTLGAIERAAVDMLMRGLLEN